MSEIPTDKEVGFVPTMGALHQGHLSLVERGRERSDYIVVSIFVNPTQFNDKKDLKRYPRTPERDLQKLKEVGVYAVLLPTVEEIYPNYHKESSEVEAGESGVNLNGLDRYGEGAHRPGHFDGVVEVVSRLFDIVKPNFALFGEKDYQQLVIVRHMVKKLNYNIEIVASPTIRESDGLAMSSRNALLSREEREGAPVIYEALKEIESYLKMAHATAEKSHKRADKGKESIKAVKEMAIKKIEANPLFKVEYLLIVDGNTLLPIEHLNESDLLRATIAVVVGKVRLIDNIELKTN